MSSTPSAQKNQKMCVSPQKYPHTNGKPTQKPTPPDLATYELLSTNCTMVGSNNLALDSRIYNPKLCAKSGKSEPAPPPPPLLKKPQSPRTDTSYGGAFGAPTFPQLSAPKSYASLSPGPTASVHNGAPLCSPSGYSNPSPSAYPPPSASPYNVQISSPANSVSSISSAIKSPVPSPQGIRPSTPQPILPQAFQQIPVMTSGPNLVQIIHTPNNASNYQNHQMITRQTLIAPPTQTMQSPPPIIKIKPPLNILPKPPSSVAVTSASSNKGVPGNRTPSQQAQLHAPTGGAPPPTATQLVLPNQAILPAAQPGALLLNQMPLIVQQNTAQGVQLILRPGTPNSGPQLATASAGKLGAAQNLILQQPPTAAPTPQVLIQHAATAQRQTTIQPPQQLVRVLTANGMIQQLAPAYIAMNNQQLNIQQLTSSPHAKSQMVAASTQLALPPQGMVTGCVPAALAPQPGPQHHPPPQSSPAQGPGGQQQVTQVSGTPVPQQSPVGVIVSTSTIEQLPPPKRKPKKKKKNTGKLDLVKIMKLSGIGDDDDLFESDASESAIPTEAQQIQKPQAKSEPSSSSASPSGSDVDLTFPKRIGNIHISAINPDSCPKMPNTSGSPAGAVVASRSEPILTDKPTSVFGQSQISVQQSLSDINAINQNLTQIGLINQNAQNFISANNQILSQINTSNPSNIITQQDNQNLASFLQAINSQNFPILNGQNLQNVSAPNTISVSNVPCLTSFSNTSHIQTSNYQKFPQNLLPSVQTTNTNFTSSIMSNLAPASQNLQSELPKSQPNQILSQSLTKTNQTNTLVPSQTIQNISQNISNTHFNISGSLPNIQVQNFCGNNPNLILNQSASGATILTPNIPNFSGNITINNSLIPNTNLTLSNNLVPNFLPTNLMQQTTDVGPGFGNGGLQRTGGFKLALSEDGRLILQHDPNLNQDIQSQLLLQSIFGINLQGGNLVLTSVNNQTVSQAPKPVTVTEPPKKLPELTTTKTTSIIQNVIPSTKTESQPILPQESPPNMSGGNPGPNNFSYIVNLTPDQLETLKRNGQLNVNGQTIFMHRPNMNKVQEPEKITVKSSPKSTKNKKKIQYEPKNVKTVLQDHLNIKNQMPDQNIALQNKQFIQASQQTPSMIQSPNKNVMMTQQSLNTSVTNQQIVISSQLASPDAKVLPTSQPGADQNIICIPSSLKNQQGKINEPQIITQHLMSQKTNILKQNNGSEQLIILQQQNIESKQNVSVLPQNVVSQTEKKLVISNQDITRTEQEVMFPSPAQNLDKSQMVLNGNEALNVEQFLSNLNITPANLGQLISQKLSQEIPGGVDHKIVNVQPGATAGHIVAKIDISSENMQQILNNSMESNPPQNSDSGLAMPPLISMNVKQDDAFSGQIPPETSSNQLPTLIIGNNMLPPSSEVPNQTSTNTADSGKPNNTVYQRIQTIQLTPQKQQLLKNVQLQIQAFTAKLQQKTSETNKGSPEKNDGSNISDSDIHNTLRLLFIEQQKILATGKILPTINQPISSLNCHMETNATQSIPVTTASKNNNTFLTSLLQQPIVSHHQNQKVFYHHGNQIIAINPNWQNSAMHPPPSPGLTSPSPTSSVSSNVKIKKCSPQQVPAQQQQAQTQTTPTAPQFLAPAKVAANPPSIVDRNVPISPQPAAEIKPGLPGVASPGKRPNIVKPTYSKAQLIEQQLTTDQNGAMNPDITTPFANKADACKRLVRYHCYNQPVLSQKDLNKADEIFELTAMHFIDKFRSMVNKYKLLLFKESMREVQTSELMMIDRMFLAEEQQSFFKLQSDIKMQNEIELQKSLELQETCKKEQIPDETNAFEDIKPYPPDDFKKTFEEKASDLREPEHFVVKTEAVEDKQEACDTGNADFNIKCGLNYFSDESCESTNYRLYGGSPRDFDEFVGKSTDCFTSSDTRKSVPPKNTGLESYNTTKIIGNFEIEINNKGCNSQESYTKNFRQKIIDGKSEPSRKNEENFGHKSDVEDYDEWLCIQRELGYFPEGSRQESEQKTSDSTPEANSGLNNPEARSGKMENEFKKSHKRSSSDSNRLETLKKFRVEKHNSKVKKTGSIIGEVKFEVRIEHKKVFTEQSKAKSEVACTSEHTKAPCAVKRAQCFDYQRYEGEFGSKRACVSHRMDLSHPIKQEGDDSSAPEADDARKKLDDSNNTSDVSETFDRSIDEQVQSAIDSILNLQQITSMTERSDLQEAAAKPSRVSRTDPDNQFGARIDDFTDPTDTLDEAVKSILS